MRAETLAERYGPPGSFTFLQTYAARNGAEQASGASERATQAAYDFNLSCAADFQAIVPAIGSSAAQASAAGESSSPPVPRPTRPGKVAGMAAARAMAGTASNGSAPPPPPRKGGGECGGGGDGGGGDGGGGGGDGGGGDGGGGCGEPFVLAEPLALPALTASATLIRHVQKAVTKKARKARGLNGRKDYALNKVFVWAAMQEQVRLNAAKHKRLCSPPLLAALLDAATACSPSLLITGSQHL